MTSWNKFGLSLRKICRLDWLRRNDSLVLCAPTSSSPSASSFLAIAAEVRWRIEFLECVVVVRFHLNFVLAIEPKLPMPSKDLIISEIFLVFDILTIVPNKFGFWLQWPVLVIFCSSSAHLLANWAHSTIKSVRLGVVTEWLLVDLIVQISRRSELLPTSLNVSVIALRVAYHYLRIKLN